MKVRKKGNKVQSLKSVSLKLLIPIGLAVAGLLSFMLLGMRENRRLAEEYIRDTAELYVGQINRDIAQINSELVYILEESHDIGILPHKLEPQDAKYYETLQNITNQNRILKIRYSEVQKFYVYTKEGGVLITDGGVVFPSSIKSDLYEELTRLLARQPSSNQTTHWQFLNTTEESYIVSWLFRDNIGMGCVINLNTIFDSLKKVMKNYEAIPFVKDTEGKILMSEHVPEHMKSRIEEAMEDSELYSYKLGVIGEVHLYIVPGSGMLEQILYIQAMFVFLILVLLILCGVMLYVYYGKIMTPMKTFVEALDEMNEEQMLNENGSNNILELEFASGKFRTLLRKIQSLKIAIYEKELQEQKAELEYVQEQLRPHFLLNCLSVIHGMADAKEEREIVHITEVLSDYMRYVMRDSRNQRPIGEELEHIAAYVEMQKLRYGENAFSYEVIQDAEVTDCLVPPLLLQTLVENAIVHEVSLDKKINISLYITIENYEDVEYLYISISDTGKGFSEETLNALENDIPIVYNGRKHVGLQNIQRRLQLMYGGKASVEFSNMDENFGAVVEVRIPLSRQ